MPFHKEGAYDGFDSLREVKPFYKYCRTSKHFILSKQGVQKNKPTCAFCDREIIEDIRCEYHPKTKKIICLHYECSWKSIFNDLERMRV